MLSIRGGSGLGDSLYLQAIVRHLIQKGESVEACTDWPDLFEPLAILAKGRLELSPFRRTDVDRIAHYVSRKSVPGTSQFEDCCIRAGVAGPIDLRLDWEVKATATAAFFEMRPGQMRASGQALWPVILVALPRSPMGRSDGFGAELLPDCRAIQRIIDRLHGRAFIVQVGAGEPMFAFDGLNLDLANRTTVRQLIDVASLADGFIGYPSFMVPLCESFAKPGLFVWSRRGLNASGVRPDFIRTITPGKVLHRETSRAVLDDVYSPDLDEAADALHFACGGGGTVPRPDGGDRRLGARGAPEPARAG